MKIATKFMFTQSAKAGIKNNEEKAVAAMVK